MAALLLARRSAVLRRLVRPTTVPLPPPTTTAAATPLASFFTGFTGTSSPISTRLELLLPSTSRLFSSSPSPPEETKIAGRQFKHQEIEGPTVERDLSALAQETRETLKTLQKVLYDLSKHMAVLALAHLLTGFWIVYHAAGTTAGAADSLSPLTFAASLQGFAAFAFPFAAAFLIRRSVPHMRFFQKMEEQGRLQILTLSLQISKCVNLLLQRIRLVSGVCVAGISLCMVYKVLAMLKIATESL